MKFIICIFIILELVYFCVPSIVKPVPKAILIDGAEGANLNEKADRILMNREHVRRKRYLGLSKKYKLNKRYQECVGPGDAKGHCKHLTFCPIDILTGRKGTLEYLCVIEKTYVGVCCPDDVALSSLIGSQLILDLPAGGEDYDENNNVTGCGISAEGRLNTPVKGARVQQWPWLAALYYPKDIEQNIGQQFCGGALITDTHILTAAHCLQGLSPQDLQVRLGEYDFSKANETRSQDYIVAEINIHENFDLASYENDIALIRLVQPTTFNTYIWPVCLPPVTDKTYEEEVVTVVGWGRKSYAGLTSEVLLQVAIPVWNQTMCVDSFLQKITYNNICAAGYEGGRDACQGDSGGPLMFQLENGRWITIGIVSWGIECGSMGKPGIYTRVDQYIPWIIHHTIAKE